MSLCFCTLASSTLLSWGLKSWHAEESGQLYTRQTEHVCSKKTYSFKGNACSNCQTPSTQTFVTACIEVCYWHVSVIFDTTCSGRRRHHMGRRVQVGSSKMHLHNVLSNLYILIWSLDLVIWSSELVICGSGLLIWMSDLVIWPCILSKLWQEPALCVIIHRLERRQGLQWKKASIRNIFVGMFFLRVLCESE